VPYAHLIPSPPNSIDGTVGLPGAKLTTIHHTAYLTQIVGQSFMLRRQRTASDSGGHNVEFAPVDHHGRDNIPEN